VLDVGSGNGLFLYMLWRQGKLKEAIGVDIAADRILAGEYALTALGADNVHLIYYQNDSEWPNGVFDVVIMIDVMHHISSALQRSFFEKACASVSRNGKLIYKDMCRAPAWRAWANRLHDLVKEKQWIEYRGIEDVERWARSQGLSVNAAQTINMYYYGHEIRIFDRIS
jgi:cyclopropane fatty-acyl-phospholipid synthase-like methyltransferase